MKKLPMLSSKSLNAKRLENLVLLPELLQFIHLRP
jgi:hypothetical protein